MLLWLLLINVFQLIKLLFFPKPLMAYPIICAPFAKLEFFFNPGTDK